MVYRQKIDFEKVDPKPVAVLGPVPSIREQTAALMQDPRWLVQQLRQKMQDEAPDQHLSPEDNFAPDEDDWDDDEPEWFTGYQLHEMKPIHFPEDKAEATQPPEEEALMGDAQPDTNPSGAEQST